MIRHIVLVQFKSSVSDDEIADIFSELHSVKESVAGVVAIAAGKSESPEKMERGYMHGFTVDLADWDALAAYQADPEHRRLSTRLVEASEGGVDGILVFDLEIADAQDRP